MASDKKPSMTNTTRRNEIDPVVMHEIESKCHDLGRTIASVINTPELQKKYGFALMVFSFEGPEFTYISNSEREGMIKALNEFLVHLEKKK